MTVLQDDGLGSQAMLTKIDKLRELNVGSMIPLPQLVVVGDQSSGKSSVLESLTGFCFPRAPGLCTRYATQISCYRDNTRSVAISIIPRPDADERLKTTLLNFRRQIDSDWNNDKLAAIFEEANVAMGIRMTTDNDGDKLGAFSPDILKVEVHGPDQDHLTVIDVPGIFRVATPGLTTDSDIVLVENMVKSYMSSPRTIILAVMPCNVDIATQEILKLAEVADPEGVRTMGVLTKPDLATEVATRNAVIDLVRGNRSNIKLGYYVVKNRSADDASSTLTERAASEAAFFSAPPWTSVSARCGIQALKERLRQLLMSVSKQQFPRVKADIEQRLRKNKTELQEMGPPRSDQSSQRMFLGKIATSFQAVTQAALDGHYARERLFAANPDMKLITKVLQHQEAFADTFRTRGHTDYFDNEAPACKIEVGEVTAGDTDWVDADRKDSAQVYEEISDILLPAEYNCPLPGKQPIMDQVQAVFDSSRGPDIGTFGGTVLSTIFEQQSEKWEKLTLSHVSRVIYVVHDFARRLLSELCPEDLVRSQLWNGLLLDQLRGLYRKSVKHAQFLLSLEREARPTTFNHYFNDILQKKRSERMALSLDNMAVVMRDTEGTPMGRYVSIDKLKASSTNKGNDQQVCEDILDIFESYYKVAQKRFVDVLYQQVISHILLEGDKSPLKVFSPDLIMRLSDDQLEQIAGEDEQSRQQREALKRAVARLEQAVKLCSSTM